MRLHRRSVLAAVFLLTVLFEWGTNDKVKAAEPEYTIQQDDFEVPAIAEEIEAVLNESLPEAAVDDTGLEERKTEELYRLLEEDMALSSYGKENLASIYDPRVSGLVTPIRNQSSNTCWAFSTLGAGEQSLVYKGISDPMKTDLSEAQLIYFFYHPVEDPLGNTAGDGNYNLSSGSYLAVGSNTIFSTFALANWVGAAEERVMPFEDLGAADYYDATFAYTKDVAHLQNAYWINFKDVDAVNVVKQMVQKYGGAAINFYWNYSYFNSSSNAYYYPLNSEQANNHSVTIVGWDDTYAKENFQVSNRPSEDGAWIVKNSYGENWGEKGYFYLSYEDSAVNEKNTNANRARAYIYDLESADNYDYNYQYDGSAGAFNATNSKSTLTKVESGGAIANVFTAKEQKSDQTEMLKAVSFALFDTAVSYEIQIYKNLADKADPTSGTPQLSAPVTGSTSYAGYYTIPLPQEVLLESGETFSVVITLKKKSQNTVEFFVDKTYQNGSWISFVNQTKAGESFRYVNGVWEDMQMYDATVRIKAFTDVDVVPAEQIAFVTDRMTQEADGGYSLELWSDETYSMEVLFYPSGVSNKNLQWSSSAPDVVTVDELGRLTPKGQGSAVITAATLDGSNLSLTCRVTVKVRAESLRLSSSSVTLEVGDSIVLTAILTPENAAEDQLVWESTDSKVAAVEEDGTVEAVAEGTAVITVRLKSNDAVADSCKVTVSEDHTLQGAPETKKTSGTSQDSVEANGQEVGNKAASVVKSPDTSDASCKKLVFWIVVLAAGLGILSRTIVEKIKLCYDLHNTFVDKVGNNRRNIDEKEKDCNCTRT